MARIDYYSHPYINSLDEYQAVLLSMAQLSEHLLRTAQDHSSEDWHMAACWLMAIDWVKVAEKLPFPALDAFEPKAEADIEVAA